MSPGPYDHPLPGTVQPFGGKLSDHLARTAILVRRGLEPLRRSVDEQATAGMLAALLDRAAASARLTEGERDEHMERDLITPMRVARPHPNYSEVVMVAAAMADAFWAGQ